MSSGSGAKKVMGSLVRGWIKSSRKEERLPVYKAVIRMVEKISGKRVADVVHMNPYLVGSSRVQSQADIGKIILLL